MELEKKLIDAFFSKHPTEALKTLHDFDGQTLGELLETLDPRSAAMSLRIAPPKTASIALDHMKNDSAAKILQQLPFDTQLVFLHSLNNAEKREQILNALSDTQSKKLRRLLNYPVGSAGNHMDPSPVSVLPECLVKDALKQIHNEVDSARYYIYVTDIKRRLLGMVTLQELFKVKNQVSVASIMSTEIKPIPDMASERDIIKHPSWRNFHELPVVDRHQVLIGVIRYETLSRLKEARFSDQAGQDSLTSILALSELYWLGMTGFLDTISITADRDSNDSHIVGKSDGD